MSSPTPAGTGGWLTAAQRVALPHGDGDTQFAHHVTRKLLDDKNSDFYEIVGTRSSATRVEEWAALFGQAGYDEIFEFFSYRPRDVAEVFAERLDAKRRWSILAEIYEALYALATGSRSGSAPTGGLPYAARIAGAHLARTRWKLLSLAFIAAGRPPDRDLRRVDDDTGRLVALAQQARADWLAVLGEIDDYPQLARRIGDVEADARDVTAVPVTCTALGLDPPGAAGEDDTDAPGREAARFAVVRLLLPRFALLTAAGAVLRSANRTSTGFSAAALAAALSALVLAGLASIPHWSWAYTAAAIAAAGVYVLITAATAADARAAWP